MKVTITFDTDNAAFGDHWAEQVTLLMSRCAGLLRELGNNQSTCTEALLDISGNRVGSLTVAAGEEYDANGPTFDDLTPAEISGFDRAISRAADHVRRIQGGR